MQRLSNWLAWGLVAVVIAFAALNLQTLMTPAPINLVAMRIDAPLGLLLLGVMALVVVLFFFALLRNQIGSLLETRRLLKEIQRVQGLADQAEASRLENLHQMIVGEFGLLNERLNALSPARAQESRPPQAQQSQT